MAETLFNIPTEEEMLKLGGELARSVKAPCIIFLHGELGAGKTTMVRGFLQGLGYEGKVKSPSYNLVEYYDINGQSIFHFDFYRIQDAQELEFIGIQDYWQPSAIFLVEWPQKVEHLLPPVNVNCYFEIAGEARKVRIERRPE